MTESTQPTTRSATAPRSYRLRAIRIDGQNARCATDSSEILIPRVAASYLRPGDSITPDVASSPIAEYLAIQNAVLRKAHHLYPAVLPLVWDPSWNQWKHLVGSKAGLSGTFVVSGKYRHNGGEWQLVQWETALPSRLTVNLPSDVHIVLAEAKRAYQRFGEHYDSIQRIRVRLEREPLDEQALSALCRQVGIPSDFDVMQFCWKPNYDPYYYQQLKRRSQNVYSFRGEYLFQLPLAMVGEIPQLGNATYVFAKPPPRRSATLPRLRRMSSRDVAA